MKMQRVELPGCCTVEDADLGCGREAGKPGAIPFAVNERWPQSYILYACSRMRSRCT